MSVEKIDEGNEAERLREASRWWLRLQEETSAATAGEWLAWSQRDPANLDAFDRVETSALELRRLDVRQRQALAREFAPPERARSRGIRFGIAAGFVLVAAGLGYFTLRHFLPFIAAGDAVYATEHALHQNITLADGSQVTVGASSVVAVRMRENERRIQLRDGEAYFEVRKDPVRPFVVAAGTITVTAVGTAFNVRRTGADIVVSVTEGRVRVAQLSGDTIEIKAGERIAYESAAHRFKLTAVSPERAVAWRERRLEFVNEPLAVVVANVNRYASPRLSVADADVGGLTFTGTVLPDNLAAWLDALPQVLPVAVERDGDEVSISKR